MEIIGNIVSRKAPEAKTETFTVQEFILDASYVDNYTQQTRENILPFQVSGKNIEAFAAIPDNARVKVFFMPRGRYYEKKDGSGQGVGLNLDAWKFEVIALPQGSTPATGTAHY